MPVIFNYKKEKSKIFGDIYRPRGEITIHAPEGTIKVSMYIDPGADITLIPKIFGEALGFEWDESKVKMLYGIDNKGVPVNIERVNIEIGNYAFMARIAWSQRENIPPLLGRMDVFVKFKVLFNEKEKTIKFEWQD